MKCPKCKKEIREVNVISECVQKAEVDKQGKITDYDGVDAILGTVYIEHNEGECRAELTSLIKD